MKKLFDEHHVVHELKHYLPSQQALKDFIHHNPLHAFQGMKFYDAIFRASTIFGYQVSLELPEYRQLHANGRIREDILEEVIRKRKGDGAVGEWKEKLLHGDFDTTVKPRIGKLRKHWKSDYRLDLDNEVHPLLFRILCSFLDQGIAVSGFPVAGKNFLESVAEIERNSFASFFKTKRIRELFLGGQFSITALLRVIVGDERYFEQYLFDQQFTHHGWSGFVSAVEDNPQTLLDPRRIALHELIAFELLLELDVLYARLGNNWAPLTAGINEEPADYFADVPRTEVHEVLSLWQDAFEWSYYDTVIAGMLLAAKEPADDVVPTFQAIFCIDERECSIRRHIEATDPGCETFGAPGFFGVEFYFQQEGSLFYDKLCPAPVTPKYLIKETSCKTHHGNEPLYSHHTHGLLGGLVFSAGLGLLALYRKVKLMFWPEMTPAISNAYGHMTKDSVLTIENKSPGDIENGLQVGYTVDEMATRAEGFLRGIGLVKTFYTLVYIIAHGSSSANNPHHGAHDCGACSGRPGATNARVMAYILNHVSVRKILAEKGIDIPVSTRFVGAMHDTAADRIAYYDDGPQLSTAHAAFHQTNSLNFETALDLNAKERSRRFASINTRKNNRAVRKAISERSVSLFEPRPELGHGTNTLCIVGRRCLTRGLFLDRRAFLNSYDYRTDPDGAILTNVMKPIGLVCGGINLEYYFSRVDNIKLGAGTKLPHNVMGLFGVANSSDGDLRPGLPWQMIEVHDPVRLLVVVEHEPAIVLKSIQSSPEVFEWYKNEWVHIMALSPSEKRFYYFTNGAFEVYEPVTGNVEVIDDLVAFIESAKEMETNHIVDATKENLPVGILKMRS